MYLLDLPKQYQQSVITCSNNKHIADISHELGNSTYNPDSNSSQPDIKHTTLFIRFPHLKRDILWGHLYTLYVLNDL